MPNRVVLTSVFLNGKGPAAAVAISFDGGRRTQFNAANHNNSNSFRFNNRTNARNVYNCNNEFAIGRLLVVDDNDDGLTGIAACSNRSHECAAAAAGIQESIP
jgi:hypothetical protein